MKRIKALVAAVALAASGVASAITTPGDVGGTQGADVIFLAFDQVAKKSFVFDTNISFSSLLSGATATFNLASNSLWTSFLSQTGGSFEWLVWGGYSTAASQALFSANPSAVLPTPVPVNTSQNVANLTNLGATANNFGCAGVTTTCSVILDGNVTTNWGGDLLGTNSQFANDVGFRVTGVNGNTMSLYNFVPGARGQPLQTNLITTASLNNGTLLVGPVPEPSTYALMVAGLLTVGAVARRRMRR